MKKNKANKEELGGTVWNAGFLVRNVHEHHFVCVNRIQNKNRRHPPISSKELKSYLCGLWKNSEVN